MQLVILEVKIQQSSNAISFTVSQLLNRMSITSFFNIYYLFLLKTKQLREKKNPHFLIAMKSHLLGFRAGTEILKNEIENIRGHIIKGC